MGRGIEYIVGCARVVAASIHSSTKYESGGTIDARGCSGANGGCHSIYVGRYDWCGDTGMGAGMVVTGGCDPRIAAIMANAG